MGFESLSVTRTLERFVCDQCHFTEETLIDRAAHGRQIKSDPQLTRDWGTDFWRDENAPLFCGRDCAAAYHQQKVDRLYPPPLKATLKEAG